MTDDLTMLMIQTFGEPPAIGTCDLITGIERAASHGRPYEAAWITSTLDELGINDTAAGSSDQSASRRPTVTNVDRSLFALEDALRSASISEHERCNLSRFTQRMLARPVPTKAIARVEEIFVNSTAFPTWAAPRDGAAICGNERIDCEDPDAATGPAHHPTESSQSDDWFLGYDVCVATAQIDGRAFVLGLVTGTAGENPTQLGVLAARMAMLTTPDITDITVEPSHRLQPTGFEEALSGLGHDAIAVTCIDTPASAQNAIADIKAHGGLHSGSCRRPGLVAHHISAVAAASAHNRRTRTQLRPKETRLAA
ncbi:hypothetical protein [Candidatus Poriferisodalis sp.]|uniref:hypothetical protein n=1 Tax=Candidatus Poriferisodalis sp. TaxID=3101277 RepID=UPI003B01E1E5